MKKKYQKPVARDLGNAMVAAGSCNPTGLGVAPPCSIGSSYTDCILGPEVFGPSCNFGRSATNCPTGVTANP
jgi:hypothetical protein